MAWVDRSLAKQPTADLSRADRNDEAEIVVRVSACVSIDIITYLSVHLQDPRRCRQWSPTLAGKRQGLALALPVDDFYPITKLSMSGLYYFVVTMQLHYYYCVVGKSA